MACRVCWCLTCNYLFEMHWQKYAEIRECVLKDLNHVLLAFSSLSTFIVAVQILRELWCYGLGHTLLVCRFVLHKS